MEKKEKNGLLIISNIITEQLGLFVVYSRVENRWLFETHFITSSSLRASKQLRKEDSNTHCFAGIQEPIAICLIIAAKSQV